MKALTLTQPWATLVALGAKQVETRSWRVSHRNLPLAIHAAKSFPRSARALCAEEPFRQALKAAGYGFDGYDLPTGVVLATVTLLDCCTVEHLERAPHILTPTERAFGNSSPGRFAWRLWKPQVLPEPAPARGSLGLWEWEVPRLLAEARQ